MKKQKYNLFGLIIFLGLAATAQFDPAVLPPVNASPFEENQIWLRYCIGDRKTAEIPKPNYENKEVLSAVRKLAMVSPYSFYFYSGPLYAYELKKGRELLAPPANFPDVKEVKDGRKNAHAFMTVLCGEFRDRPTLIESKVKWVNKMHTLPETPQKAIHVNHDLWANMSAHSYKQYIELSQNIFQAKKNEIRETLTTKLGKYEEDYPIEPYTVCETKYIFNEYIYNKKKFDFEDSKALAKYRKGYERYKSRCSKDDLDHIYDFRGDSNFKPNSPESNGMIWYSSTITNNCMRKDGKYVLKESATSKFTDPQICEKYFMNPFAYRWSAARAGLATWLLRDKKHDSTFSSSGQAVHIVPHLEPMLKPFSYKLPVKAEDLTEDSLEVDDNNKFFIWDENYEMKYLNDDEVAAFNIKVETQKAENAEKLANSTLARNDFLSEWENAKAEFWKRSDLGFNSITGLGTNSVNFELAYERLRDAVNRHTDWYSSGYEDGVNPLREQAYSPFVASSYEMSASDAFTAPGTTVQSPADGCKHWMFVFKLKKSQWYNTKSVKNKVPVDFNHHWFDETSFGTNHLADTEHAFDRLGTALEGEMDAILYLHKINTRGQVDPQCGFEQMGLQVADPEGAVGKK